jgi:hypothetical protein
MGNVNYCAGCTDEYAMTEDEEDIEKLQLYLKPYVNAEDKIIKIQSHFRKYKARN